MRSLSLLALSLIMLAFSSGCYRTTIVSGRPPRDEPATSYDHRLTSIIAGDVIRIDKPYDIGRACPGGWGMIEIDTTFVDGVLDVLGSMAAGLPIYQAKTVTLHCAGGPVKAPSKPRTASRGSAKGS